MMNKKIEFSKISKFDACELAELDAQCFSIPWSEKAFLDDIENPLAYYVLARIGGELAGYCGIYKVADEGHITNIAVKEKFRRQGIANEILKRIICYAKERDIKTIFLEVRESNASAISLYSKFGFVKVGYRKNYYHAPVEGAVLMDLNI